MPVYFAEEWSCCDSPQNCTFGTTDTTEDLLPEAPILIHPSQFYCMRSRGDELLNEDELLWGGLRGCIEGVVVGCDVF